MEEIRTDFLSDMTDGVNVPELKTFPYYIEKMCYWKGAV